MANSKQSNSDKQLKPTKAPVRPSSGGDRFKWFLFWVLVVVGIVSNIYYQDVAWSLRASVGLVVLCVLVAIGMLTQLGQRGWKFAQAARGELRKVVWPSRSETTQTSLIVIAMVVVVALILWALDSLLMYAISFMTR